MFKRSLSFILAFTMIAAVFTAVSASAAESNGSITDESVDMAEIAPTGEPTEPTEATEAATEPAAEPSDDTATEGQLEQNGGLLKYSYDSAEGVVQIIGAENLSGDVVLPATVEGYPVAAIGAYALMGQDAMTSVTVPDSVKSIGAMAFGYDAQGNKLNGFTVKSSESSPAADYADENGFDFEDVNADQYPHITSFVNTEDGVKIQWSAFEGADFYRVYYKNEKGGWTKLASKTQREYVDTSVKGGETRIYTVRALNKDGDFISTYSSRGWSNQFIEAPTVRLNNAEEGVMIRWNACAGAEKYRVFYYGRNGWTKMAETTETSYLDTDVRSGNTYIYTVRCISADSKRYTGDYRAGKKIFYVAAPHITSFTNTEDGVKITWNASKGADYYRLYYRNGNSWTKLVTQSRTEYIDTSIKGGETRLYTVRCLDKNGDFVSDYIGKGWSNQFIEAPTVKLSNAEEGVMIRWNACAGAEKYRIFYYGRNGWTKMAETTGTSYLDKDVRSGSTYIYTVRCISADGKRYTGDYRAGKKIFYVAAPHITNFQNTEDGVKITWDAVKGADYYRIYYKSSSGWTKLATKAKNEYVDTSVKDGETRLYTVRCLDDDGDFVSDYIGKGWTNTFHAPPKIDSVSSASGGNLVKWSAGEDVAAYRLYRKVPGGSWSRLFDSTDKTSYLDTTVKKGQIYAYTLRYLDEDGNLISDYRERVRYYKDGKIVNGNVESNGTYGFDDGYLRTGLKRISGKLYHYSSKGLLSRDTIIKSGSDYYYTDKDGVCWESKEMRLAAEFIERYCKGNTLKEKVKYGFMYLADNYTYKRVYNDMPTSPSDIPPFAEELFTLKRGTCYRYASGFAYMAKIAGYRSRFCFGYSGDLQHGWTELYVDGSWLICDVDAQLPSYGYEPYAVYLKRNHVWILDRYWYSELTVKDGKASWGSKTSY